MPQTENAAYATRHAHLPEYGGCYGTSCTPFPHIPANRCLFDIGKPAGASITHTTRWISLRTSGGRIRCYPNRVFPYGQIYMFAIIGEDISLRKYGESIHNLQIISCTLFSEKGIHCIHRTNLSYSDWNNAFHCSHTVSFRNAARLLREAAPISDRFFSSRTNSTTHCANPCRSSSDTR